MLVNEIEPTVVLDTADSDIESTGSFSLVDLEVLNPILGSDLIGGEGTMNFTVEADTVRELTFR